jgi:hypothetical protein
MAKATKVRAEAGFSEFHSAKWADSTARTLVLKIPAISLRIPSESASLEQQSVRFGVEHAGRSVERVEGESVRTCGGFAYRVFPSFRNFSHILAGCRKCPILEYLFEIRLPHTRPSEASKVSTTIVPTFIIMVSFLVG